MTYNVLDVTEFKRGDLPEGASRQQALEFIRNRLGCDRDTAEALYESRAVEVTQPTIVIFKKRA